MANCPAKIAACFLAFLFLLYNPNVASAQTIRPTSAAGAISGIPFLRNYTPDEYQANGQNWAIAQDRNGILYFGNSDGVLEYDGVAWRSIPTENKTVVRSLAIDKENRVYVGAYGEIGYLAPDKNSQLQYHSLLPQLDKQYLDFSDVWQTIATSAGVYFVTQKYVFRWAKQRMHVWKAQQNFHVGFLMDDQFYVRQWGVGLMRDEGDSLNLAPGGARLADERVFAMLPWSGTKSGGGKAVTLIATRANGLYLYDGVSLTPFPTAADAILKEAVVYHGVQLPNGRYAFATLKNGVIVIDGEGRWVHHLNKASGLQDETVWFLYADRQDGLWMGLDAGISRVEIASPFTHFTNLSGMEGYVLGFARHQGTLYAATSLGTYYLDYTTIRTGNRRFKRMVGIPPQCWALLPMGQSLLVASFDGVFEVRGQQVKLLHKAYTVSLHRSQQDTNRVFVGLQNGMMSLYREGAQWRVEGRMDSIDLEIREILETPDQKLWVTSRFQGILKIDYATGFNAHAPVVRYDTLHGLPPGDRNFAFLTGKGLRFGTNGGIYRLDETQQRFIEDTSLIKGFPKDHRPVFFAAKDARGNLCFLSGEKSNLGMALLQKDGSYTWDEKSMLRIANSKGEIAYPDPFGKELVWLGGNNSVIQYDASVSKNIDLEFPTQIRQVIANGDSLIFGGAGRVGEGNIAKLSFAENTLRFSYSAPSFDDESKTEYQYRLEGYDENWSKWTTEPHKDYTKLPAGAYRFLVRAKNIYQHVGSTASFEFKILPPFYQTWWAYCFYALLFIGAGYALRQFELRRLRRKQAQEMEHLELNKLKELDHLKSRFFADISHEFRTPLTVISGMADLIEQPAKSKELIMRNSEGLLRLVNQMLDLAKLESGQLKLDLAQADVVPYVQYLTESFQSLAAKKNIRLAFTTATDRVMMDFDEKKLESIVSNLLHNAIKFSKENGKINLHLRRENGQLLLKVKDNGIGIPPDELPHIFERFYQVKGDVSAVSHAKSVANSTDGAVGSGIGLALTKELVELMGGEIRVTSADPATGSGGTEFTVSLPIRQNAPLAVTDATAHLTPPVFPAGGDLFSQEVFAPSENEDLPLLLLIEDNDDVAFYIQTSLQGRYAVMRAANGAIGIEKALEIIPDIIISDVMMPEKDGFEVCQTLKNDERTCHIPIVLLTAKADVQSRLEGLGVGADAYLSKPFLKEELFIRLEKLVELRRRLQEKYAGRDFVALAAEAPSPAVANPDDAFLKRATRLILDHLDDALYGNEELARAMTMSESSLNRKVKAITDKTLSLFIRSVRLQQGKTLLQTTDLTVSEIAYAVGFTDPFYFSRTFSQEFGAAPSSFRS